MYYFDFYIIMLCIQACDEQCNALILDDETFEQIVMPDALGRDFVAQRDNWKEGQGFSFMAEFLASKSTYEEDEEGEASSDDLQEGEKLAKTLEENGILKINDIVTSIEGQGEGDSKKKAKKSKK
ncbi:hypothetical protein EON65_17850 [archaeon]|nr:MAG: hypothetical protein EON65_17850 [archaeon]